MKRSRKWLYWATAVPLLGAAGLGVWKYAQPSTAQAVATTMSPIAVSTKPGAPVNRVEHLTCEVSQGWPVILVRDANDQSPWWVQGRAERQEAQTYSARAHFGNETTVQASGIRLSCCRRRTSRRRGNTRPAQRWNSFRRTCHIPNRSKSCVVEGHPLRPRMRQASGTARQTVSRLVASHRTVPLRFFRLQTEHTTACSRVICRTRCGS